MIRLPLVLVCAVLGGLAVVGVYEWFGPFVAGLVIVAAIGTWFEIRLNGIADHLVELEATLVEAELARVSSQGRCGALAPMAYPGQPGTTACELAHGHGSDWHRGAPQPGGLPGMEWRARPSSPNADRLAAGYSPEPGS